MGGAFDLSQVDLSGIGSNERYIPVDNGVFYDTSTGLFVEAVPKGTSTIDAEGNKVTSTTTTFKPFNQDVQERLSKMYGTPGGSDGSSSRLASDDPRYWQLQYDQLAAQYMNMGLDAESARRQALTSLITNRNNTAVDTGNLALNIAKQKAEYQAHPRDAFAELFFANQTGPVGSMGNVNSPEAAAYRNTLKEKGNAMFTDVNADLNQLRLYRDSIPPVDFFGPEQRSSLGLEPTTAQALTGAGAPAASSAAPPVNGLAMLEERLRTMSPTQQEDFREYVTGGAYKRPVAAAKGGTFDFEGMFSGRDKAGFSPSSSEGGTNLNIHERAVVVGESGQIYATLGEKRPDGTMRAEQLMIKPLKSEVAKDKKLEEGNKAVVESQKKTLAAFDQGGTVTGGYQTPTPPELLEQLRIYLGSLGGSGGGAGYTGDKLPDIRLLAGAPANALAANRRKLGLTMAGYDMLGISNEEFEDTIAMYTPNSAQRVGQTAPRVSFA